MHRIKKVVCVTFVIPFDVTLTRYQASYGTPTPFKNVLAAAKAIKSEGGYAAFGRGWTVMCTRRLSHSLTLSDSYRRKSRALYLFWARESPTQALPSQECSSSAIYADVGNFDAYACTLSKGQEWHRLLS